MNVADDELLAHEIDGHQFTEPLKPPAEPPTELEQALVFAATERVWFRVGWTCLCAVQVLETAEKEMLLRGLLKNSLDIYQLQGTAKASAGTHALYACYDIGQTSDAQIDIQRLCGGTGQRRTTAQGFSVEHVHGFPNTCHHGSPAQKAQQVQWDHGQNGLISHGSVQGRWPVKTWPVAVTERKKVIMAFVDDIAAKTAAKVGATAPSPQDVARAIVSELDVDTRTPAGSDETDPNNKFWRLLSTYPYKVYNRLVEIRDQQKANGDLLKQVLNELQKPPA